MKEELLIPILEKLRQTKPKKAKKIEKLVSFYHETQDEEGKQEIKRKIYNIVYHIFSQQISPKTRQELSDLNSSIGEDCYQIEQKEKGAWIIGYDGAVRRKLVDDQIVITNIIPREYHSGFHISGDFEVSKEDRKYESEFYQKYHFNLDRISTMMDKKIRIHSGEYEVRNQSVDRKFVDLLIEFLGFRTLEQEKAKQLQK